MLLLLLIIGCTAGCTNIEAQTPSVTTPTLPDTIIKPVDKEEVTTPSLPPANDVSDTTPETNITEPPQDDAPETEATTPSSTMPPVHVHNYTVQVIEPGCTSEGYSTYTCQSCGNTYSGSVTSQRGHQYGDWVITKEPTCIDAGESTRTCTICGHTQVQQMLVPGHQYKVTTMNPTCTEDGYTLYQCTRCAETRTMSTQPKIGHSYSAWRTVQEATTTKQGIMARTCAACDDEELMYLPTKVAVNLENRVSTAMFDDLNDEERALIDLIITTVRDYEGEVNPDGPWYTITMDHGITFPGYYRVCAQLCFYYGTYYEIWDYMNFYFGTCKALYIDMAVFKELEANRQTMMNDIDNVLSTFADGTEEELVMQTCYYISELLDYDAYQEAAAKAFATKYGSCNSYSVLMKLMLHRLGIDSDFCTGFTSSGGYHAWIRVNYAEGNAKYYDLTFYESSQNEYWLGATDSYHTVSTVNEYSR